MKLEFGNFYVKDICFGDKTFYKNGLLTINKEEALALVNEDEHIISSDIVIAKPGDEIRIIPVKDAFEPRCRIDGGPIFPGVTGELIEAGHGRVHALKNTSVLSVGKHYGGFQDGLIDMSGEGAKHTYYSQLINICLVADTDEDFERYEQQKQNIAINKAAMKLSEYIGNCTKNLEPEEMETFELEPITKRSNEENELPAVALVLLPQSQLEQAAFNERLYGWDTKKMVPTFMHPNTILDGAMISGSFTPSSSKWATYDIQNFPVIKRLYKEHGKTINFAGVIVSNLQIVLEEKERSALFVTQIAKSLGLDGAIIVQAGYGNCDADLIGTIVSLENAGIKTTGIATESPGRDGVSQPKVTLDKKADALVTTGNVSELIELPPMKTVIGELESLGRDGFGGGWADDTVLGPSVRPDGSIIMEENSMFCGDQIVGWSPKIIKEY